MNGERKGGAEQSTVILRDLLSLTVEEQVELYKRIEANRGTVQIWVHSHFENDDETRYPVKTNLEEWSSYKQTRDFSLKRACGSGVPIIFLIDTRYDSEEREMTGNVDYYRDVVEKANQGQSDKEVYFLETFQGNPTPRLGETKDPSNFNDPYTREQWDAVASLLRRFRVQK